MSILSRCQTYPEENFSDLNLKKRHSSESPVHGAQEGSAYNGHFESVCYHPLFLFNEHGDCVAATRRPGNVHSADDWDDLLVPEIERQQSGGHARGVPRGRGVREAGDLRRA